jgi:hypothetical protein
MLAAVPLSNHNPVRREIWIGAWTYSKSSKVDQLPLRFAAASAIWGSRRSKAAGSGESPKAPMLSKGAGPVRAAIDLRRRP